MNFLDRLIGVFSPRAQLKRAQYREANKVVETHKRKYEGAAGGRRFFGWRTVSTSANAEIEAGLVHLRNRSRDLIRNNPYAKKAQSVVTTNVIGPGIMPSIKRSGVEDTGLMELWKAWAETTECDYEDERDFYGIQDLVMDSIFESGEVIVRRRVEAGGVLPFKLQVLESDFLPLNSFILPGVNGNTVKQGVEFNPEGKKVAYHLYKEHPGNTSRASLDTVRVDASEVLHIGMGTRPGQIRFIPWLSAIILRLRDFDEYEDAQLVRQKIAACFTAFVHDNQSAQADLTEDEEEDLGEKMEPGLIEHLPPGKEIKLATPPVVENYGEYASVILHSVATGTNISYEALTGNLSEVNFSSARMGFQEMHRSIVRIRSRVVDPRLNKKIFKWFLDALVFVGKSKEGVTATWTAPRREMVDPTKEVPAAIKSLRAGISTLSDVVRQTGKDPAEHFKELAEDNKTIDKYDLKLDSDPRNLKANGALQDEGDNVDGNDED